MKNELTNFYNEEGDYTLVLNQGSGDEEIIGCVEKEEHAQLLCEAVNAMEQAKNLQQSSVIKSLPSDDEIKNEDRNINGMLTEEESEIWRDGARHLREMVRKLGNVL